MQKQLVQTAGSQPSRCIQQRQASLRACRPIAPCFTAGPLSAHPAQARQSAVGAPRSRPRTSVRVAANSLIVKDNTSGAEFPLGQRFWFGDQMRCLGAGTKIKKILLFSAKVYSVALYVEGSKAAKELGIRSRGGFFESDDDYCQAITDGAQNKALVIRLVRDVDGATFGEAIEDSLTPRMQLIGDMESLAAFKGFFDDKQLNTGTEVAILWTVANDIQVSLSPSPMESYTEVKPPLSISSPGLGRALFELYLGAGAVVPEARKAWVQGIKNLLDYDNVKRSTRQ